MYLPSEQGTTYRAEAGAYRAINADITCHRLSAMRTSSIERENSYAGAPHSNRNRKVRVLELLIHTLDAEGKTISLLSQGMIGWSQSSQKAC